jgi:hypothetical protein
MDLRQHTPHEVEAFIKQHAPKGIGAEEGLGAKGRG